MATRSSPSTRHFAAPMHPMQPMLDDAADADYVPRAGNFHDAAGQPARVGLHASVTTWVQRSGLVVQKL